MESPNKRFRSLKTHQSLEQTTLKSPSPNKKLTVVTKSGPRKKVSPVSFKNAFRSILICPFGKGENEEESEVIL
jgi:hypothetical protein